MADLDWSSGRALATGPIPKPKRGDGILAREKADKERIANERLVAKAVKARDEFKCRWPEVHKCRGGLEAAHIRDKSLCGPTETENEIALCAWIHRRGPESIHGKELRIICETERGADGPVSFWRFDGFGWYMVARETQRGIVERD